MTSRLSFAALAIALCSSLVLDAGELTVAPHFSVGQMEEQVSSLKPGDRLVFKRGTYLLRRSIKVRNKSRITIEGEKGAVLSLHCNPAGSDDETSGAFQFDRCTDLTLRGFSLTTDNPIGCQGTVVAKDDAGHRLHLKVDSDFPITGNEHYFQLNTVDDSGAPDGALEVHTPIALDRKSRVPRYVGLEYEQIGSDLVSIRVPERASLSSVTNLHRMLVRYFRVGETPVTLLCCTNTTFEDIEIERTANLGVWVGAGSRNLTFRRFNLRPPKGSRAYAASNSDAIHIRGLSGEFTMQDCHFKGLGDDAFNIHSMAAEVVSTSGDGRAQLVLRGPDRAKALPLPPHWAVANDTLEVYDANYARRGTVSLREFAPCADGARIAFGGLALRKGDVLVNAAFYPRVTIEGCSVENTRARAFLLQTHNVKISNCRFRGLPLPALIFAVDFVVWNEAGPSEDVEVTDCLFENCARNLRSATLGTIVVKADHDGGENNRPAGIHRNLRFANNTFRGCGSSSVYVASADGVEVEGNRFLSGSANPRLLPHNKCAVRLKNCTRAKVDANQFHTRPLLLADPQAALRRVHGPEAWLEFIGGNVAKDGLRLDLEAIKSAGFSGVHFFHIAIGGAWPGCTNQIPCMSEQWADVMAFLGSECRRLGLALTIQNCPGWSQSGGPWIDLDHCQRHLRLSRLDLRAGDAYRLPAIPKNYADADSDWRDVAVIAFPTPLGDGEGDILKPTKVVADGNDRILSFDRPVTVRSLVLPGLDRANPRYSYEMPWMHVGLDVMKSNRWHEVFASSLPVSNWRDYVETLTLSCGEETGRVWRFRLANDHPIRHYPEPQLGAAARMTDWEGKSGRTLRSLLRAEPPGQNPKCHLASKQIVDLTGCKDWKVPAGRWTVLRFGSVNAKYRNSPAPWEATGWECDKLDPGGVEANFNGYLRQLAEGALKGRLDGFLVDSWECFTQTWTPKMERFFLTANGYRLREKLPALFGWVIDSPKATEAFLTDWRRTLGDLVTKNYFGRMAQLAHDSGLSVLYETAFGDIIPGDLLEYWKYADEPMCEFWLPHSSRKEGFVGSFAFKPIMPCASAAHVYGKNRVTAEAFTEWGISWKEDFRQMRDIANRHFAKGVTHLAVQSYTHAPQRDAVPPGGCMGGGNGTPFTRLQTWWKYMGEFTAWLRECEDRLESGLPGNDVLWYLGDAVDHKPDENFAFVEGFRADYVNTDVLVNRLSVKDGHFVIPEGTSWRLLWVPDTLFLRPESRMKLAQLQSAGGKVVFGGKDELQKALAQVQRDVVTEPRLGDGPSEDFMWLHRKDGSVERYFVAAGTNGYLGKVRFRALGSVSVYDPVTRERTSWQNGSVLQLYPSQSVFVEFDASMLKERVRPRFAPVQPGEQSETINAPWKLSFAPGWDAPDSITIGKLVSWTDLPNLSEAARAYSGTVRYETTFKAAETNLVLDLGGVETIAEVFVNGERVRTLWCEPYRVDISRFSKLGHNSLRVDVTGTWHNRVFYDQTRPVNERKTWALFPSGITKEAARPIPQGLLGPVRLVSR